MRPLVLAALAFVSPATADDSILADALAQLPEPVLSVPAPELAQVVSMDGLRVVAETARQDLTRTMGQRLRLGGSIEPLAALTMAPSALWETKAGVALDQVRYFAGYGQPPATLSIWGLANSATATALLDGLAAKGFAPSADAGVLTSGKPGAVSLTNRDPSNPWRGMLGKAFAAAVHEDAVLQTPMPQMLQPLLADGPRAADNAYVTTALAGVTEAAGDGTLVQALLISPVFGLQGLDPARMLDPGSDIEAIRDKIAAELDAAMLGIPPYLGGIIADVQAEQPITILSVVYADCTMAEAAAAQIAERWEASMSELAPGARSTSVTEGTAGHCAAVLTVTSEGGDPAANLPFAAVIQGYMQRQFDVLQVGATP